MTTPLVHVESLSIPRIVEDISFDISPGERVGLIGESGSGKSMTAMSIMGLVDPRLKVSGSITVHGQEVTRSMRGTTVAMVFQEPMTALDPLMTVERQVAEASSLDRARELLREVGIERTAAYPHELSGGQRQRVAVGRAVLTRPRLILADEPTGNLDSKTSRSVLSMFRSLVDDLGQTLFMITHDAFAAEYGENTLHMQDGRLTA